MAKAKKTVQLGFTLANKVGLLSEVCSAIAGQKVNITSICAYETEGKARFLLTVDSAARAKKALGAFAVEIVENDAICVEMPDKAGELQKVAAGFADAGINITEMYGSAGTGRPATCIFRTADNKKALRVINR